MASSSSAGKWWKVEETLVHLPGLLGQHPASGHTYLTPVDLHPLPRNAVIGWALLYDEPVDEENFKEALSHTLSDFPVVAGRFAGPAVIRHNNAGVPLVICKDTRRSAEVSNGGSFILQVDAPSSFSLKKDSGFPSLLNPMRLRQVYRGREAAVSFRLTRLACGGTVLGVTATHALVDGSSLCRLLMSLSLAYRGLDRPAPYLDRRCLTCQPIASLLTDGERGAMAEEKMATAAAVAASLSGRVQPLGSEAEAPCRPLVQDSLSVWQSLKFLGRVAWGALRGARGVGEVVARISPREIEACKRAAGGASRISKNDVAAAFAWTLLRKMQGSMGLLRGTDREQRARMLLAADLRRGGRCEGLPSEYFGNAALAVEVEVETGAAEDAAGAMMTLPLAAAAIRSTVSALKPEMTKSIMRSVWTACQASALGRLPALVSSLPCYHDCLITSWQFPLRELDFGAGDPVGFFPGVLPRCPWTAVVLADGAGGGGALVHMTLPSEACDLLRRDPRLTAHLGNAEILQNTG